MKLTASQRRHLVALSSGKPRGAYPGLHMGVLKSLSWKALVIADYSAPGALSFPQVGIKWRITPAGRAALEQSGEK